MQPVGPIADQWRRSRAFVSGICGPVGSGKTSTGVAKCFGVALAQKPVKDKRGISWRRAKIGVIRDTYPNLDGTVLATWHSWVPKSVGHYVNDYPRSHHIQVKLNAAGTEMLDLQMEFIAIGENRVEDVLRGKEWTAAWLNEGDRLAEAILGFLAGRVGRYPGFKEGGCVDPMIMIDMNAVDTENWLYRVLVDKQLDPAAMVALQKAVGDRPLIEFYRQPGAREPGAENLHNLPPGYYELQIALNPSKDYLDRMVDNKFVPMRHGQPVYPEFNFGQHIAPAPLVADPARKLIIGLDAGLTPAAVVCQRTSLGQLRVLGEFLVFPQAEETLSGVGPTRFGKGLKAYLAEHFPEHYAAQAGIGHNGGPPPDDVPGEREDAIEIWCDPSAKDGTDNSGNEQSWMAIVQGQLGRRFKIRPARSNALHVRLEAVRVPLVNLLDGQFPGFLISPTCKILRKGFLSGYHYRKVAVGDGSGRFDVEPNKNMYSHGHDALQYAAMADGAAMAGIMGRDKKNVGRPPLVDCGNDYFSGE